MNDEHYCFLNDCIYFVCAVERAEDGTPTLIRCSKGHPGGSEVRRPICRYHESD